MMRDELAMYLTLAPEFGGKRFGPFEGMEVRLGANSERNNIVLPESFGVAKDHARLMRQQDTGMVLAPSERTAAVWVWKGDARKPIQILTATAVRNGDSFALGSPEGPKFFVELGMLPAEVLQQRRSSNKGLKGLTGEKLAKAGWDLFLARLYAFSPVSILMRGYYFVKSGAIFQPRILLTLIMTGFASLTGFVGMAYAAWTKWKVIPEFEAKVDDLEEQNAVLGDLNRKGIQDMTPAELSALALRKPELKAGLDSDEQLAGAFKAKAAQIVADSQGYHWLFDGDPRGLVFQEWRTTIEKNDNFDPVTKQLLPWIAATGTAGTGEFNVIADSKQNQVCGRGPFRMTWRQGRSLGLEVQYDRFVNADEYPLANDETQRRDMLTKEMTALQLPVVEGMATRLDTVTDGSEYCAAAEGQDGRSDTAALKAMLVKQFGTSASEVASSGGAGALTRVAKFYAADWPGNYYAVAERIPTLKFRSGVTSGLGDSGSTWPLDRTAIVLARATVLPCKARLAKNSDKLEPIFGKLPDPVTCLVLFYKLQN